VQKISGVSNILSTRINAGETNKTPESFNAVKIDTSPTKAAINPIANAKTKEKILLKILNRLSNVVDFLLLKANSIQSNIFSAILSYNNQKRETIIVKPCKFS